MTALALALILANPPASVAFPLSGLKDADHAIVQMQVTGKEIDDALRKMQEKCGDGKCKGIALYYGSRRLGSWGIYLPMDRERTRPRKGQGVSTDGVEGSKEFRTTMDNFLVRKGTQEP